MLDEVIVHLEQEFVTGLDVVTLCPSLGHDDLQFGNAFRHGLTLATIDSLKRANSRVAQIVLGVELPTAGDESRLNPWNPIRW